MFEKKKVYTPLRTCIPLDGAHILIDDEKWLNFTSFDYLSLAHHSLLKKSAIRFLLQQGIGTISAQVDGGRLECHAHLEERLASLLGHESTLLSLSQGHALTQLFSTLPCTLLVPAHSDPILLQAASCSKEPVYLYSSLEDLEKKLGEITLPKMIVTPSLFYPTGEKADLNYFLTRATKHKALLCVDDTHAFGILGTQGRGLGAHLKGIDILLGSFNRCGAEGAFIATSSLIKDYLVHCCPSACEFVLSPATIGMIDTALDLLEQMEGERAQIEQRGFWLQKRFEECGFTVSASNHHFLSISLNNQEELTQVMHDLSLARILAIPFFDQNLVTFILNSQHTPEQLQQLVDAMKARAELLAAAIHSSTEAPLR